MATSRKLKDVPTDKVVELVKLGGQKHAANVLNVGQSTISRVMRGAGYEPRVIWIKREIAS